MTCEITTKRLILRAADPEMLRTLAEGHPIETEKARLLAQYAKCIAEPEKAPWHTVWQIFRKKDGKEEGFAQFHSLPEKGRVEVNCALNSCADSEKIAAEALKSMAKWAFANQKDLYFVSTWLADDDSPASQVLENAGFGQTFEADGMVHYEMSRPRISLLALTMCLFTALSFIPGYLFDSYPLFVTLGIVAGIFPGHLLETKVEQFRIKRSRHRLDHLEREGKTV